MNNMYELKRQFKDARDRFNRCNAVLALAKRALEDAENNQQQASVEYDLAAAALACAVADEPVFNLDLPSGAV